ncbi:MAG: hypothetical protein IJ833_06340 [Lachnospiraceae bacterium]|nr:hypothetical protein [Lachnospiraceae bacterium]
MDKPNLWNDLKYVLYLVVILCFAFVIYISYRHDHVYNAAQYEKKEFTRSELDVIQSELQITIRRNYQAYKGFFNYDRLYLELYTNADIEDISKELFGIDTGDKQFEPYDKWVTLEGQEVPAMSVRPHDYDSTISEEVMYYIWKRDSEYGVSVVKSGHIQQLQNIEKIFIEQDAIE